MTKRSLVILIVAVLAVGGATAVVASSIGRSDEQPVHTLSGGETHTGAMPPGGVTGGDGTDGSGRGTGQEDTGGDRSMEGMDMDGDGQMQMGE